jgi:hypothetical protein
MKSKEEILYLIAENEPDQFDEFAKWVDQNGGADEIDTDLTFKMAMQAMDEYASQQTAAISADYEEVLADHKRLVREIDEIISGENGMAKQASLCDLVGPIKKLAAERDEYREALEQVKSYLDSFKHEHQEGEELLYVIINTVLANYKKEVKQ